MCIFQRKVLGSILKLSKTEQNPETKIYQIVKYLMEKQLDQRGKILNACVGTPIKIHNKNIFSDIREKKLDEPNTLCQGANQIDIHKMTKRDD